MTANTITTADNTMKNLIKLIIALAMLAWFFAPRDNADQQRETYTVAMLASNDAINDPSPQ